MGANQGCKSCGEKLIVRQTRHRNKQLKKNYYYSAYYFCPQCQKIYLDDKFKVMNNNSIKTFFDKTAEETKKTEVEIWTDGACLFNGQEGARAAWAFVACPTSSEKSPITENSGLVEGSKQTNNVAEALAIYQALVWAVKNNFKIIKIYSDSQVTIHNLKKPTYLIKSNKEIFQNISEIIKQNNLIIYLEKVLGHSGNPNNERADRLANLGAAQRRKLN